MFVFGPDEAKAITSGYPYQRGEQAPAIVVRASGDVLNLHVIVDGPQTLWVTSVLRGTGPRSWEFRQSEVTTFRAAV